MRRIVQPEKLDSLPPDHPDARASRRDLRFFNWYLGTERWFEGALLPAIKSGDRVLELGAGEGRLLGKLQAACPEGLCQRVGWVAMDFHQPEPCRDGLDWICADLLRFDDYERHPVVLGNMILHHFEASGLARLGKELDRHSRLLVFQEPARRTDVLFMCQLASLAMNRVTRHDAPASIRGGFRANELPQWLGLDPAKWHCRVEITLRGAYRLLAQRR